MYKLVPATYEEIREFTKNNVFLKRLGHANELPEPYEEISHADYISYLNCIWPTYRETRYIPGLKGVLFIEWQHTQGIGVVQDIVPKGFGKDQVVSPPSKFFRFGCKHKWPPKTKKYQDVQCEICGTRDTWDSSD